MALTISLTQAQYESLISFARRGATSAEETRNLSSFLKSIESSNNITVYTLWVQWQEAGKQIPITVAFPATWPPELRFLIQSVNRPIARADVTAVLASKAVTPMNVMVTKDPAALVGWTELDTFFPS